jgi:hypothetical protein
MAITPLPTPPSRSQSPATFSTDADAFLGALPAFATEANALATDVNADEASAAAAATTATNAASIAVGAANYQGAYSAGVTYQIGQSVSSGGRQWVAKTINTGVTPVEGANWLLINDGDVLGPVSATNNALALYDGTSGKIIKSGLNNGTAGQALLSGGSGNAPVWGNVEGGVRQFTASGSITAGQPVCLRSDGAVEVATGFQQAETLGAAQIRAGADSTGFKLVVPIPGTSNLLVTINNGAARQVLVASVSGETITYNTATTAPTDMLDSSAVACTFDPVSGSALFTYSVSGQWRGVVCTITGTTVAFGSPQVISSQGTIAGIASCYDSLRQQIIVGATYFPPSYSTQTFEVRRATISGTSFTVDAANIIYSASGLNNPLNLLYDTQVNRIVAVTQAASTNNVLIIANSGSGLMSVPALQTLGIFPNINGVTFDTVNNKYVAVAPDGSNNPVARTFSITASSITVDAAPTFPVLPEFRVISSGEAKVSYDVRSERVVYIFYTNANNIRYITSTGFGASMAFSAYNGTALTTRIPRLTYLPAQNRTIFYIISDSNGANLFSFRPAADISNTQNFIGLAAASATTGQTLNVTVTGGTNANQTGLTTGASYFLTSLGALTTAGGVRVGEALSATSMFVEGRLNSSGTPSSTTFLRGDGAFVPIASTVTLIASAQINSSVAEILINNLNVTPYRSIILEFMIQPDSNPSSANLQFVAPGGNTQNGNIVVGGYSNEAVSSSLINRNANGVSSLAFNSSTMAGFVSEIYGIVNVQNTSQTTSRRAFIYNGFGDTNNAYGFVRSGGGYSSGSTWGGFRIFFDSGNIRPGSYYRIYGVI